MLKKEIRLFFRVCVIQQTYECIVRRNTTLNENIKLLQENLNIPSLEYLVYEKDSMQKCSKDVPLQSLNLYDGMTLLLF